MKLNISDYTSSNFLPGDYDHHAMKATVLIVNRTVTKCFKEHCKVRKTEVPRCDRSWLILKKINGSLNSYTFGLGSFMSDQRQSTRSGKHTLLTGCGQLLILQRVAKHHEHRELNLILLFVLILKSVVFWDFLGKQRGYFNMEQKNEICLLFESKFVW